MCCICYILRCEYWRQVGAQIWNAVPQRIFVEQRISLVALRSEFVENAVAQMGPLVNKHFF